MMDGAGHFTGFAVNFTLCCLCGEGSVVRGAEVGTNNLKQEGGRLGHRSTQCPWVSSLTCSFLRVTLDKSLKILFLSQPSWRICLGVKKHQNDIEKQSVPLHCPFQGKQIILQHPPVRHREFPVCPLWSPVEKPGCNINYTNGTLAYSNIVQCLFISQNVCTVLITVLSVCVLLISNANIERFLLLSSFFHKQREKITFCSVVPFPS